MLLYPCFDSGWSLPPKKAVVEAGTGAQNNSFDQQDEAV